MKDGFICVAAGTPKVRVADCRYNAEQIFTMMREAEKQGVRKGVKQGRQQGRRQGRRQGEEILGQLVGRLLSEGRTEDARLAAEDEAARRKLYREYGILNGCEARD